MKDNIKIEFKQSTIDDLLGFSEILNKDVNTIIAEALEQYFENEQKKLIEKGIEEDASMTNLDYDEFWDGLDIG
jgi:tRNA A37 N6-isopentenylltransferase MiaA